MSPEEANASEPEAKVAWMSEAQVDDIVPEPWRAPVAQMLVVEDVEDETATRWMELEWV